MYFTLYYYYLLPLLHPCLSAQPSNLGRRCSMLRSTSDRRNPINPLTTLLSPNPPIIPSSNFSFSSSSYFSPSSPPYPLFGGYWSSSRQTLSWSTRSRRSRLVAPLNPNDNKVDVDVRSRLGTEPTLPPPLPAPPATDLEEGRLPYLSRPPLRFGGAPLPCTWTRRGSRVHKFRCPRPRPRPLCAMKTTMTMTR